MSKSESYRNTPIPYHAKNGDPMTYFIVDEYSNHTSVTRAECLARQDAPDGQPTQRWFVDEESGLVVRLPRTKESEELARDNMQFFWREAKRREREFGCIYKGTDKCNGWKRNEGGSIGCDSCERRNVSRTVETDMFSDNNGEKLACEHAHPFNMEEFVADKLLFEHLAKALDEVGEDDKSLLDALFIDGRSERDYAAEIGISHQAVGKRKAKALEKLRGIMGLKKE
jgi:RNA polymerase sigma factor (sigma-70 family)